MSRDMTPFQRARCHSNRVKYEIPCMYKKNLGMSITHDPSRSVGPKEMDGAVSVGIVCCSLHIRMQQTPRLFRIQLNAGM